MKFYEREDLLQELRAIQDAAATQAQMTAITGRRRSGRTQLIMKATEGRPTLYFYIARKAESILCYEFQDEMQQRLELPLMGDIHDFRTLLKQIMAASKERTFNVVIDEVQEFNTINQGIYTDLQNIWDRNKDRSHLCLFLLGSDTAPSMRLFDGNHAPLAGRVTNRFCLKPYSSAALRHIMAEHYPEFTAKDLLAFWTFTGGVQGYVEKLVREGAFTADAIIDMVTREDSYFLNEGRSLLVEDFGKEYTIYFSILACIALDITSRSLIEEYIQKEIGGYLTRLETDFHLIRKQTPLFSKSGSKNVRYTLDDNFLRFWFRYIYRNMQLVSTGKLDELREKIRSDFDAYAEKCLLGYYVQQFRECGEFTTIGGWWDHRGENDLDLIGINENTHKAVVARVAYEQTEADLHTLARKTAVLPEVFQGYEVEYRSLGLEGLMP
ncbi:MAG: AAA family ATPase [Alloprevotella sp.]|nr:AAA family ATPase [Alloprevotella sp.]